jgi:hypothetical protein
MALMLPPIIAQTMPGTEIAQAVLNADAVHALQFIVFLLATGLLMQTWLSGRSVNQMSATQASMGRSNEKFFEADAKKTAVMQATVDEIRMLRESNDRNQKLNQLSLDAATEAFQKSTEANTQTLINHTSTLAVAQTKEMTDAVTDLLDETTAAINAATIAAVEAAGKPALEAIGDLKSALEGLQKLQTEQMNLMKRQQDAQIDALKDLFDGQMTILANQLDKAEKRLILSINLSNGSATNESQYTEILPPVPPIPAATLDAGAAVPVLVPDGGDSAGQLEPAGVPGS